MDLSIALALAIIAGTLAIIYLKRQFNKRIKEAIAEVQRQADEKLASAINIARDEEKKHWIEVIKQIREEEEQKRQKEKQQKKAEDKPSTKGTAGDTSRTLREKGNEYYIKVNGTSDLGEQLRLLNVAIDFYKQAIEMDTEKSESVSAKKNIARAIGKKAELLKDESSVQKEVSALYRMCIERYADAYGDRSYKEPGWGDGLLQTMKRFLDDAVDYAGVIIELYVIAGKLPDCRVKTDAYIDLVNWSLDEGSEALDYGDAKQCLVLMSECNYPIEEVKRMNRLDPSMISRVIVLEKEVLHMTRVAESELLLTKGDKLMAGLYSLSGTAFDETVIEIIDLYRSAATGCAGSNSVQHAKCLSRLGKIFVKIGLETKAKSEYEKAFMKARNSRSHGRSFMETDWYKECASFLRKYEEEKNCRKNRKNTQQKKIRETDQRKLRSLKGRPISEMIKCIYEYWPPKNGSYCDTENERKLFFQAMRHYHPDKQEESFGEEWYDLCTEITALLTTYLNI